MIRINGNVRFCGLYSFNKIAMRECVTKCRLVSTNTRHGKLEMKPRNVSFEKIISWICCFLAWRLPFVGLTDERFLFFFSFIFLFSFLFAKKKNCLTDRIYFFCFSIDHVDRTVWRWVQVAHGWDFRFIEMQLHCVLMRLIEIWEMADSINRWWMCLRVSMCGLLDSRRLISSVNSY